MIRCRGQVDKLFAGYGLCSWHVPYLVIGFGVLPKQVHGSAHIRDIAEIVQPGSTAQPLCTFAMGVGVQHHHIKKAVLVVRTIKIGSAGNARFNISGFCFGH